MRTKKPQLPNPSYGPVIDWLKTGEKTTDFQQFMQDIYWTEENGGNRTLYIHTTMTEADEGLKQVVEHHGLIYGFLKDEKGGLHVIYNA